MRSSHGLVEFCAPRFAARAQCAIASLAAIMLAAIAPRVPAQSSHPSPYLFVWVGDLDHTTDDFLGVIDANPASPGYGHVIATVSSGAAGGVPHHTEYVFPADTMLLANAWAASRTYLFDLRQPTHPSVSTTFHSVADFSFPHSFARLANGHLVGTFQGRHGAYAPPGGLVELDERGTLLRSASAAGQGLADTLAWPYSLAIDVPHDRIVVSNSPMPISMWLSPPPGSWTKARADSVMTSQVEIWSLSQLKLLHVVSLPRPTDAPMVGDLSVNSYPAEPRLLPDGSMYVNTFGCGLYRIVGLAGSAPRAEFLYRFPSAVGVSCAVPAIVSHFWIQTVPAIHGLIALDIRDPAHPVEVSRLTFGDKLKTPHWIAADPEGNRLVVTGLLQGNVMMVDVNPQTGALSLDARFHNDSSAAPGLNLDGRAWPHGTIAHAVPHGALFGPR